MDAKENAYYPRGFGLKAAIAPALAADYHSAIVTRLKESGHVLTVGDLTFRLAREFGFCYGVDRAVEYAYETCRRFPGRRIFLTGEIIHNPHVNRRMEEMGIRFLRTTNGGPGLDIVTPGDVVILPAFGVTIEALEALRAKGAVLVDTTCGSVMNVWKNVERFSSTGFTALIHGKIAHEETRATASRASQYPGGRYLVVRDRAEAEIVCAYIRHGGDQAAFLDRFPRACSPGFSPDRDLQRVGLANQTTMLSSESIEIQTLVREALLDRHGPGEIDSRFRAFDTICSATQDRQDAVLELLAGAPDLMIVIGGYNSSNTTHLAALASRTLPAYHIDDAACIRAESIRHQPPGGAGEVEVSGWLPAGRVTIGLTAGASTPNNKIGEVVEAILNLRGLSLG